MDGNSVMKLERSGSDSHPDNGPEMGRCVLSKPEIWAEWRGRNLNHGAGHGTQTQPVDPLLRLFDRNVDVLTLCVLGS